LEEQIYVAAETFIQDQNTESYRQLNNQADAFRNRLKTKDEQLAFVFLLCNKAYYSRFKAPDKAIKDYEEAWSRYTQNQLTTLSDYDIIENCLKPLGNLYIKGGDYTNAENIIKHYISLAEAQKNPEHRIAGAINLAVLYQTLGKYETVLTLTSKAMAIEKMTEDQRRKLENLRNTSLIASGKLKTISVRQDNSTSNDYNTIELNYQLALKNKDFQNALIYFNRKKKLLEKDSISIRTKAKLSVEEAQIHSLLDDHPSVLKNLQDALQLLIPGLKKNALPVKEQLYADATFTIIFDILAGYQPTMEQALYCYDLSLYVSGLLYDTLTSQESKIEHLARNRLRDEKCINLLYKQFQSDPEQDFFDRALGYAEESRSLILKEMFTRKSLLEQFPDDTLLIRENRLLKKQEYLTNKLIEEQLGRSNPDTLVFLGRQLHTVSMELKNVKAGIQNKYTRDEIRAFNKMELQQKLKKDAATLVEYFYGNQAVYQFVITPDATGLFKIELDENAQNQIRGFNRLFENASIINNDISTFRKHAFDTFRLLKFDRLTSYKNIVVIPDGLLSFIPFEALLTATTSTNSFADMPFVVKKHQLVYNSSITFYLNEGKRNKNLNALGIFPVFEGTDQKLIYSVDEAGYLKEQIPGKLLMHEEATRKNFLKNAKDYGILHLSTHANSGTRTKAASIDFYDETMTLNELYSLDINARLVVLSACETGVGKAYKSEGPMSLSRGFQYAGVENILFSLWPINDQATSLLMKYFYEHYSTYHSEFEANHDAKIRYLLNDEISNSKKSPYFWSSFVFYGQLQKPLASRLLPYYLLGAGAFVVLMIFFYRLRRKKV
jgi:CHAT domain-containing protein